MPTITLTSNSEKLDGSLKKKVYDMLSKLAENDAAPGLHVEPLNGPVADGRIRSVRVDDKFRALVFRIDGGAETHYVYVSTHPHDDAYDVARKLKLQVNPVNGVLSLIEAQDAELEAAAADKAARAREIAAAQAKAVAATVAGSSPVDDGAQGSEDTQDTHGITPGATSLEPRRTFARAGITAARIEAELGIAPAVTEPALRAATQTELEATLAGAAPWELDALLGLTLGFTFEQIRTELDIAGPPPSTDESDAEAFLRAVRHPASRMQFTYLGDAEDPQGALQAIIESGDFQAWTTFLHPTQRVLATRSRNGSWRVTGGAGTGKTVVALHRTKALVDGTIDGPGADGTAPRVLLSTFNKGLAESLDRQLSVLDPRLPRAAGIAEPGVTVAGIDRVSMSLLSRATPAQLAAAATAVFGETISGRVGPIPLDQKREDDARWADAVARAEADPDSPLSGAEFLRAELETVVLAQGIADKAGYLRADRAGRGTALNRKGRLALWSVIEAYLAITRQKGTCTWLVLACLAAAVVDAMAETTGRPFDHVVVDEAQDFHIGHWRLLRALVPAGPNDLFISEDGHQRIYGRPVTLSHHGIDIRGRATRLTLNYRTTAENLGFALGILGGEKYTDTSGENDTIAGYRSARSGPAPQVAAADSITGEVDLAIEHIRRWQADGATPSIGVLTHTNRDRQRLSEMLSDRGFDVRDGEGPGIHVLTMHKSKGLEFSHVVLVRVSEGTLPSAHLGSSPSPEDRELEARRQRSLLYVAASRARDELVVTTGTKPSPYLPLTADAKD